MPWARRRFIEAQRRGLRGGLAVAALCAAGFAGAPVVAAPTEPCRLGGIPHELRCGVLKRPLDPAQPNGRQIDVHYAVLPALARQRLDDPVFLIAGGPGQSAIGVAPKVLPLLQRLQQRRDLVFVDQRGTGRSAPLDCPGSGGGEGPFSGTSDLDRQIDSLLACRDALARRPMLGGADGLRHFTTPVAVADLEAVRLAIGAPQVNVVGISYGTRVALEWLRQAPGAIRRLVLDGVAPADMGMTSSMSVDSQAALDALWTQCERTPACHSRYPTLRQDWQTLLRSLPRQVTVPSLLDGTPTRLTLTREALLNAVRTPLYVPSYAAALPAAVAEASRGRWQAIAGLAGALEARRETDMALGMHFSVVCAEDAPRASGGEDRRTGEFAGVFTSLYQQVCRQWPRGALPAGWDRIAPHAVPALLLSGGRDPATPPRHGERVAAALGPTARHVVVPEAGHGVLGVPCMADVLWRFVTASSDAAAQAVDTGCAARIPAPPPFLPFLSARSAAAGASGASR